MDEYGGYPDLANNRLADNPKNRRADMRSLVHCGPTDLSRTSEYALKISFLYR